MMIETGLSPTALSAAGLVFGMLVGSFLNVVILRLPQQLNNQWQQDSRDFLGLEPVSAESISLAKPSSRCSDCHTAIRPQHNIPLLSFLFLRGRCNSCAKPISIQYPLIELTAGLIAAFFVYQHGLSEVTFYSLVLSYSLLVLTGIDFHEQLLPDQITLPLLWVGLLANLNASFVPLREAVLGAIAGYLSLWIVFWAFKMITGKEGMGYGDFKLLGALGAWLGWQMLPLVIFLSTTLGATVGIAGIIFAGRNRETAIAFGPFLALAGWIAFVWGDKILVAYLGIFNL